MRRRNSDRKWTLAFLGKHEQNESQISTKLTWSSAFSALDGRRTEQSVKVARIIPSLLQVEGINLIKELNLFI